MAKPQPLWGLQVKFRVVSERVEMKKKKNVVSTGGSILPFGIKRNAIVTIPIVPYSSWTQHH